jgi:hypothetical protein
LEEIQQQAGRELTAAESNKLQDHIDLVDRALRIEETLTYQELDSIDSPELYTEEDVVEVFIRANSGGTRLGRSDLLFSLLSASWEFANDEMEDLLETLNKHGFRFDRDFVLKTALTVFGHGARYDVGKFRKPGVREELEDNWEALSDAIADVLDFVRGKTFIQSDKGLPTYLVLVPLIFVRYHFPDAWKNASERDTYILRCSLAGAFSGNPDNVLDAITKKLKELKGFDLDEVFQVIRSQGRSLELTEERLWQLGYGSDSVHLLFNLWYRDFNYLPAYDGSLPQVDHVFPQKILRAERVLNPKTNRRDLLKYREGDRNQLANCMLLTREENGPGGKWDTPPDQWFEGKPPEYLDRHLIPTDSSLWRVEQFELFIAERKKLIRQKFQHLLVASKGAIQP